jgi:hypothetical protein
MTSKKNKQHNWLPRIRLPPHHPHKPKIPHHLIYVAEHALPYAHFSYLITDIMHFGATAIPASLLLIFSILIMLKDDVA